jgi:hypothetical protein
MLLEIQHECRINRAVYETDKRHFFSSCPPSLMSPSFVLESLPLKTYIFWNIRQCGPLKSNRSFGGICLLHLNGRRVSQAGNQYNGDSLLTQL